MDNSPLWIQCNHYLTSRISDKILTTQPWVRDKVIFHNTTISSLSRSSLPTLKWLKSRFINSLLDRSLNKVSILITSNKVLCKARRNLKRKTFHSNMITLNINSRSKISLACPLHVTLWSLKTRKVCWNLVNTTIWWIKSSSQLANLKNTM